MLFLKMCSLLLVLVAAVSVPSSTRLDRVLPKYCMQCRKLLSGKKMKSSIPFSIKGVYVIRADTPFHVLWL